MQDVPSEQSKYLSSQEAARVLGVDRSTFLRFIKNEHADWVHPVWILGAMRWDREVINALAVVVREKRKPRPKKKKKGGAEPEG